MIQFALGIIAFFVIAYAAMMALTLFAYAWRWILGGVCIILFLLPTSQLTKIFAAVVLLVLYVTYKPENQ